MADVDWTALREAATAVMYRAYAPYSSFPVGAAALVDDGRVIVGCNVENASYGMALCAECGVVSALHAGGGGRLVALSCVDGNGDLLMPCGRCRQLLWEHGGPDCLVDAVDGPVPVSRLLPFAFDAVDLARHRADSPASGLIAGRIAATPTVPARLRQWQGRGTVFVHPDVAGGQRVWTAYWERSDGFSSVESATSPTERGILEEGPTWADPADAVDWGRTRSPRVVVVDMEGQLTWAGEGDPPAGIGQQWADGEPSVDDG